MDASVDSGGAGPDAGGSAGADATDAPPDAGCGLRWQALLNDGSNLYGRRIAQLDRWVVLWGGRMLDTGWWWNRVTIVDLFGERESPYLESSLSLGSWGELASSGGRVFSGPGLGGPAGGEVLDPALGTLAPVDGSGAPSARSGHTTTTTTSGGVIVWGGFAPSGEGLADGGLLDSVAASWAALRQVGSPPAPRGGHAGVWAGDELLIWGGWTASDRTTWLDQGARYSPSTGEWSAMSLVGAPLDRIAPSVVWTGRELIVWGGHPRDRQAPWWTDGLAWDPLVDAWRPLSVGPHPATQAAVWLGRRLAVLSDLLTGAVDLYDPATDAWSSLASCGDPPDCRGAISVDVLSTGSQLVMVCNSRVAVGTLDEP